MEISLAMMVLIVIINLVVIGLVMYVGSQHDAHTSIRSAESSKAAQFVTAQAEKAQAKLAMMSQGGAAAVSAEAGAADDDAVSGQLGDEEARAKRREAALARKAARAATPVTKSE